MIEAGTTCACEALGQCRVSTSPVGFTVSITFFPQCPSLKKRAQKARVYPVYESCLGHLPGEPRQKEVLRGRGPLAKVRGQGYGQRGRGKCGDLAHKLWVKWPLTQQSFADTFFFFPKHTKTCDYVGWNVEYFHISHSLL